jgi:hypothetical protein
LAKVPRRIACLVMMPKKTSTRFSQDPDAGVQCSVTAVLGQPRLDFGVLVGIERLALRPLLVGAAWKVLDLLLEEELNQAGVPPDQRESSSCPHGPPCAPA